MPTVFAVSKDGKATPMASIHCQDEGAEIQELLEKSPDVLPGDQINPDDPCRWILIKREMPVPDPASGGNRWSVDFIFADQRAIPTFVECKRFKDTRSRREVVGQMLEYAANGHHYWDRTELMRHANEEAAKRNIRLEDAVLSLEPTSGEDIDDFFEAMEANLREGQVRLVFFLEEAPQELKSIVDFLNRQMERSEVLIVEAKMFEQDGLRVVAPTLFGYTEQARMTKRPVGGRTGGGARRPWDEEAFFVTARETLPQQQLAAMKTLYEFGKREGVTVRWGTGARCGSFNFIIPAVIEKSILSAYTDGRLHLNFAWLHGDAKVDALREGLDDLADKKLRLPLPDGHIALRPSVQADDWTGKVSEICEGLAALVDSVMHG